MIATISIPETAGSTGSQDSLSSSEAGSSMEPAESTPPSLSLETPIVRFFGRTLTEYTRFFSLDLEALRGRRVLDVGAGPSSFAVEAGSEQIEVTAVDPLYGCTPGTLEAYVKIDYATMFSQIRARPGLVHCGPVFASIDDAEADRRRAAARFLDDYDAGFVSGRYVGARLPELPFADGEFDMVLCGHLLFLHAAQLDAEFHFAACREMVRVSRGQVRIHPICGLNGLPYPELGILCGRLAAEGIRAEVKPVDYVFFNGADSMLVLERE